LKLSKELKEKLLGSGWEGLGIRIADLNQIADLNLTPCIHNSVKFAVSVLTKPLI